MQTSIVAPPLADEIRRMGDRIARLEADNAKLIRLLEAAGKKVVLYRMQHSGEYVGGMEFNELMRQIHEALPQFKP